ncbi:MAG: dTDP-4-dehydrorhamnose 3,5-epimerase [bacterium]|nr:dTDP-4-dehydrorhamnose 3,5-epimerase [bacterium]
MKVTETVLKDCFVIEPNVFDDHRGNFFEGFNEKVFDHIQGHDFKIKQMNCSVSHKNVLRGLHFQKDPFAQAKYVFVTRGEVLDVVVDLREGSPTYLQHAKVKLSSENRMRVFIPKGFAHGFLSLKDNTQLNYLVDEYYSPEYDCGIIYDDIDLNIDWGISDDDVIQSKKDQDLQTLKQFRNE